MATSQRHSTGTVVAVLMAGLIVGGGAGYEVASKHFSEQLAQITADAAAKLTAANQRMAEMSKQTQVLAEQDLPVRVTLRKALFGSGAIAQIQNLGSTELTLKAIATSAGTNQHSEWRLVLAPYQRQEIGHAQGWSFTQGDILELSESGYRTFKTQF